MKFAGGRCSSNILKVNMSICDQLNSCVILLRSKKLAKGVITTSLDYTIQGAINVGPCLERKY